MDLGGTLLSDNNIISEEDIKAINYAKSKGIKIALATARMYSSTKYISSVIDADFGIFSNGSYVLDIKNMLGIKKSFLNEKSILELINFAKANDLYLHINQEFEEGSDENDYFTLKHLLLNENYPEELKSNVFLVDNIREYVKNHKNIIKLVLVSDKKLDSILKKIKPILLANKLYITEFYKNLNEKSINKIINYLEIGNSKDTKCNGLKSLLNYTNLNLSDVLFVGDGENDLDVFETIDNSCCMINGANKVKKLAKYITTRDNNNSGVADAIYRFVK
ncbi:MAG: HAD-IIB family hydrolase [Bacilli bacterium]